MLQDIQNRGQLAAGMTTFNASRSQMLETHKDIGTVSEVFRLSHRGKHESIMQQLSGPASIGHVRYATCGQDDRNYAQPFERQHIHKHKWFSFCFNGQLANYNELKEKLTADLGESKANLEKAQGELTAANDKATALQEESQSKDTRISELETKVADQETQLAGGAGATPAAEGGADLTAMQTELEEAKALLTAAQDRNTGLEAQMSELKRKEDARQKSQMRQGLQGTILAVNQAWNFVVLSIGDRQGVVNNAEMLVQRGSQLLGKVRVTSVEPSTSIADIVVRTVPRGFSVMPGDTVVYPAQAN
jgi:hypothetical protein